MSELVDLPTRCVVVVMCVLDPLIVITILATLAVAALTVPSFVPSNIEPN